MLKKIHFFYTVSVTERLFKFFIGGSGMKKKALSIMLATAMISTLLAGCGGGSDTAPAQETAPAEEAKPAEESKPAEEEKPAEEKPAEEAPAADAAAEPVTLKWAIWE